LPLSLGQTEKLLARQTVSGAVVYTNRPTEQSPIAFDLPLPEAPPASTVVPTPAAASAPAVQAPLFQYGSGTATLAISLQEAETNYPLDEVQRQPAPRKSAPRLKTRAEVLAELQEHGLRVYPRKSGLPQLPPRLKTEQKPELDDMSEISRAVATRLVLDAGHLRAMAVKAALNRIKDIERHTELTTQTSYSEEIHIVTDRNALAREALAALRALPQAEEEDYRIIVQVLSSRLRPDIDDALDDLPENAQPNEAERTRLARDAAHWVILKQAQTLCEDMFSEVACRAKLIEAQPLPDVMVFPAGIALEPSDKNIYGVLPPSQADGQRVAQELFMDDRLWLADKTHTVAEGTLVQGQFDATWYGNQLENAFSRALDRASFVLWWHRNPRNKPYAVRVMRAEHDNYFYPDFVVCVRHHRDDRPILRLLETKESTKDAANKAQHSPPYYGKVLFLTRIFHRSPPRRLFCHFDA
jgi:type III restriction enzyme